MTTIRKETRPNTNIKMNMFIFPDTVLNTPYKQTIEETIDNAMNMLDDPDVEDY